MWNWSINQDQTQQNKKGEGKRERTPGCSQISPSFQQKGIWFTGSYFGISSYHPLWWFLSLALGTVYSHLFCILLVFSAQWVLIYLVNLFLLYTICSPAIYYCLDFSPGAVSFIWSIYSLMDLNEVIFMIHHLKTSFRYLSIAVYFYFFLFNFLLLHLFGK